MTSFIVEYVSEPVTRSFEGGRTHRPWVQQRGADDSGTESSRERHGSRRDRSIGASEEDATTPLGD